MLEEQKTSETKQTLVIVQGDFVSTYFTFICRWIASFFSICSMGNWGTSYGAEISLEISGGSVDTG